MASQGASISNEDLSLLEKYGDMLLDSDGGDWGEGLVGSTMDLFPLPSSQLEMDALAPGTYLEALSETSPPTGPQAAAAAAKLEWQRAIIEDELSRPLEVPEDFIQELAAREAEVEASVMRDLRMHVAAVATLKDKLYEKSEASQQTLLSSAQRLDNIASLAAAGLVPAESVNTVATRAANALAAREVGLHESMLRLQQLETRISQLEGRTSGTALASALGVALPGGGGGGAVPGVGGARSPLASSRLQHAKEGGGGGGGGGGGVGGGLVAPGRMGIAPALGLVYTRKKGNPPPGAKRMYAVERAEEALARLAAASSLSMASTASAFSPRGAHSSSSSSHQHLLPSHQLQQRAPPSLQQLPNSQQQYYDPSAVGSGSYREPSQPASSYPEASSSSSSSSSFAAAASGGGGSSGSGTFLTSLDYDPTVAVASGMGVGVLNELVSRYLSNPTPPSSLQQKGNNNSGLSGRGRMTGGAGGARFTASMGPAVGRKATLKDNSSSSSSSSGGTKLSSKQQAELEAKKRAVAAAKATRDQRSGGGGGGPKKSPVKPIRSTFGNPPPAPPSLLHHTSSSTGGNNKSGGGGGGRSATIGPTSGVARALAAERERAAGRKALVGGAARPAVRPTAAAAASSGSGGGSGWGKGQVQPRKTAASSSSSSGSAAAPRLEGGGVRGGARVAAHRATLSLFQNFKSNGVGKGSSSSGSGMNSSVRAPAAATSLGPASQGYGAAAKLASLASSIPKPSAGPSFVGNRPSAFGGGAAASSGSGGGASLLPSRSVSRPGVRSQHTHKPAALDLFVGRGSAAPSNPLVVSGGKVLRGRR